MSLSRIFGELRPLLRALDEPFLTSRHYRPFSDPFFNAPFNSGIMGRRPAVDVSEQGDAYLVETEIPGFKKENIDIKVGDNGRSLTVSGKQSDQVPATNEGTSGPVRTTNRETADDVSPEKQQISVERSSLGESSTFSRTLWLPRPVDAANVSAKLEDGVLRVRLPKSEDKGSVAVMIE